MRCFHNTRKWDECRDSLSVPELSAASRGRGRSQETALFIDRRRRRRRRRPVPPLFLSRRVVLLQAEPDGGADDQGGAEEAHGRRRRAPDDALDDEREHHLQVDHVGGPPGLLPLQALREQELEQEARYPDYGDETPAAHTHIPDRVVSCFVYPPLCECVIWK